MSIGLHTHMPDGEDEFARRLRDLERDFREFKASRTLEAAEIDNAPGKGIRSSDFDGTSFANPGTKGVYVGGDGIVAHVGAIFNDALANPVVQTVGRTTSANFALTTAWAELAGINITVPAGCSQVSAVVFGRMYVAGNPNTTGGSGGGGTDAIYVSPGLAGSYAFSTPTGIAGNGGFATTVGFESFVITGLTPGNTIRLNVRGSTATLAMAANGNNYASVVGSFTWLR